jgi:hypothetical protein
MSNGLNYQIWGSGITQPLNYSDAVTAGVDEINSLLSTQPQQSGISTSLQQGSPTSSTPATSQFYGYFRPNQTGSWTFYLQHTPDPNGQLGACDDYGILYLSQPNTTIVPSNTYTGSSPPSSSPTLSTTQPINVSVYANTVVNVTVTLTAGVYYPILFYFGQGNGPYNLGLSFSAPGSPINYSTSITDFTGYMFTSIPITCFKEDTKILTDQGYRPIQELRKGDLVKTLLNDYKAIEMIGFRNIYHNADKNRIKDQLYQCSKNEYPELFEDLIITGCHCILVDEFENLEQREKTIEVNGKIYLTDDKYRLPACVDNRTSVYEKNGNYTIYHLALENNDYYMNYGIYANGLLVETCSKRYLKEHSNMTLIE